MKALRERLQHFSTEVESSLNEIDRLCVEGAQTLSPDQFHQLKEQRQRLLNTYEDVRFFFFFYALIATVLLL